MKKLNRIFAFLFIVGLMGTLLCACGSNAAEPYSESNAAEPYSESNAAEPYIGVWHGYKVSTSSGDIVFSDFSAIAKMELTVEFTEDGKYEQHYYVAGKEGSEYPQFGKYEMDDNRIILVDDDGYGEIVNGELILYFDNGEVKQYFRPVS